MFELQNLALRSQYFQYSRDQIEFIHLMPPQWQLWSEVVENDREALTPK